MRKKVSSGLPFKLIAEEVPMADRHGNVTLRPMVRFPSLLQLVHHYLDEHQLGGTLHWHNKQKVDEVWVKIGGDHGGGTFKLCFQLANVLQPNSVKNTVPFLVFSAKDTVENLATAFKPYAEQIASFRREKWQGKNVRVILFGDYEFLCTVYGISGPSGVHPCLFCQSKKADLKKPPAERNKTAAPRNLGNLADDFHRFSEAGARLPQAKQFNNVIRPSLLPVELEDICIPVLHLDLGIFPWMFEAMLADVRKLDCELASHLCGAQLEQTDCQQFIEASTRTQELAEKSQVLSLAEREAQVIQGQVG